MSFARRNLSPKGRRFLALGNLCLATGLIMSILAKDFAVHHENLYDGVRGLLIGLAIAFIFGAFRFANRCPEKQP